MLILYQIGSHAKSREGRGLTEEKKERKRRKELLKQRFDRWAPTYERGLLWKHFFLPLYEQLLETLPEVQGMQVLDVGCGTGALARRMAERGARVTGVDSSGGMLEEAKAKAEGKEGLVFILAGAESMPLPDASVDLAVSSVALHHFEYIDRSLKEIWRVLKPGAGLYLCDMCGEGLLGRASLRYGHSVGTDNRYLTRQELAELLEKSGFSVQEVSLLRKIPPVMFLVGLKPG
jgi:ubiquinone/menaquinone biosynthesis C-methylase UbiE